MSTVFYKVLETFIVSKWQNTHNERVPHFQLALLLEKYKRDWSENISNIDFNVIITDILTQRTAYPEDSYSNIYSVLSNQHSARQYYLYNYPVGENYKTLYVPPPLNNEILSVKLSPHFGDCDGVFYEGVEAFNPLVFITNHSKSNVNHEYDRSTGILNTYSEYVDSGGIYHRAELDYKLGTSIPNMIIVRYRAYANGPTDTPISTFLTHIIKPPSPLLSPVNPYTIIYKLDNYLNDYWEVICCELPIENNEILSIRVLYMYMNNDNTRYDDISISNDSIHKRFKSIPYDELSSPFGLLPTAVPDVKWTRIAAVTSLIIMAKSSDEANDTVQTILNKVKSTFTRYVLDDVTDFGKTYYNGYYPLYLHKHLLSGERRTLTLDSHGNLREDTNIDFQNNLSNMDLIFYTDDTLVKNYKNGETEGSYVIGTFVGQRNMHWMIESFDHNVYSNDLVLYRKKWWINNNIVLKTTTDDVNISKLNIILGTSMNSLIDINKSCINDVNFELWVLPMLIYIYPNVGRHYINLIYETKIKGNKHYLLRKNIVTIALIIIHIHGYYKQTNDIAWMESLGNRIVADCANKLLDMIEKTTSDVHNVVYYVVDTTLLATYLVHLAFRLIRKLYRLQNITVPAIIQYVLDSYILFPILTIEDKKILINNFNESLQYANITTLDELRNNFSTEYYDPVLILHPYYNYLIYNKTINIFINDSTPPRQVKFNNEDYRENIMLYESQLTTNRGLNEMLFFIANKAVFTQENHPTNDIFLISIYSNLIYISNKYTYGPHGTWKPNYNKAFCSSLFLAIFIFGFLGKNNYDISKSIHNYPDEISAIYFNK